MLKRIVFESCYSYENGLSAKALYCQIKPENIRERLFNETIKCPSGKTDQYRGKMLLSSPAYQLGIDSNVLLFSKSFFSS